MDMELAKEKSVGYKNKKEQEKMDKEIAYQKEHTNLIEQIKELQPRIEKIIEIGNLCIENGINLNTRGTYRKCKYEENAFETDGIYHQLGFYPNHYQGHPIYACSHYDFIGYDMGGACGSINFITNGEIIASTPDHNGFEIKGMDVPLNKHCKMFLEDFPRFEKLFYEFIENL